MLVLEMTFSCVNSSFQVSTNPLIVAGNFQISLMCGWISAAAITRSYIDTSGGRQQQNYLYKSFDQFLQTRTAYIVIGVIAMFFSLIQYVACVCNIDNIKIFRILKFNLIVKDLPINCARL